VRIGILGTGGVGAALGVKWAQLGHDVHFGSRSPESAKSQELIARAGQASKVTSLAEAAAESDVIVVAVPWNAMVETIALTGPCAGKVVIDCVNPVKPDLSGLATEGMSASEYIAQWMPGARIVKAFNTASTKVMLDPSFGGKPATMFYCGDDAEAKQTARLLVEQIGFEPVDAGPLVHARHLESLAMLYIHLAVRGGWGSNCAFQMVKR
jgi:8-hydroxy-5-deazaflavin:NADPH oxidoreductase